jgi:hypothetical protein
MDCPVAHRQGRWLIVSDESAEETIVIRRFW